MLALAGTTIAITAKGTAASTATGAILAGSGLVDGQVTTLEILPLKSANGCLPFLGTAHGDKGESTGSTGFAVGHKTYLGGLAELTEEFAQIILGSVKREVSYIEFHGDIIVK